MQIYSFVVRKRLYPEASGLSWLPECSLLSLLLECVCVCCLEQQPAKVVIKHTLSYSLFIYSQS